MRDDSVAGNTRAYGGLALELYRQVAAHLHNGTAPGLCYMSAPHVLEAAARAWLTRAGVQVHTGWPLEAVLTAGGRVTSASFAGGATVAARVFIDATYEGDLVAAVGTVPVTVGREARAVYNESFAGAILCSGYESFGARAIDPWAANGTLLPLVNAVAAPPLGQGDTKVQSYNFRACLTSDQAHGVPLPPPRRYDPAEFALVDRYAASLPASATASAFFSCNSFDASGECDTNDGAPVGINFLGPSAWDWPSANTSARAALQDSFVQYTLGLLHHLSVAPGIPASVRASVQRWRLCADEWPDSGHLPWMPYVREGRRMRGDRVFTQEDWRLRTGAPLPAGQAGFATGGLLNTTVGLGFWFIDCHAVQRVAQPGNRTENEGCVQYGRDLMDQGAVFGLPFGLMLPPAATVSNVMATAALSASHIGFQPLRIEPTFMVLGQAAGTAAALSLNASTPLHQLDPATLQAALQATGAILSRAAMPSSAPGPVHC